MTTMTAAQARCTHLIEYQGRIRHLDHDRTEHAALQVTLAELDDQAATGWPGFHPETYCNRCGNPNTCWATANEVWNPVMRPDGNFGPWHEIICIPCFTELAERLWGPRNWRHTRDPHTGTESLLLLNREQHLADAYDQAIDTVAAQLQDWQSDYAKSRNPYRQQEQS